MKLYIKTDRGKGKSQPSPNKLQNKTEARIETSKDKIYTFEIKMERISRKKIACNATVSN